MLQQLKKILKIKKSHHRSPRRQGTDTAVAYGISSASRCRMALGP
jgi:hypothetical protein